MIEVLKPSSYGSVLLSIMDPSGEGATEREKIRVRMPRVNARANYGPRAEKEMSLLCARPDVDGLRMDGW